MRIHEHTSAYRITAASLARSADAASSACSCASSLDDSLAAAAASPAEDPALVDPALRLCSAYVSIRQHRDPAVRRSGVAARQCLFKAVCLIHAVKEAVDLLRLAPSCF